MQQPYGKHEAFLYEEVEMLRREAQKSPNNGAVLQKLDSDLSFLIERVERREAKLRLVLRKCKGDERLGIH